MDIKRILLPERDGAGRLGRNVVHDPRSRHYAYRARSGTLRTVTHTRFIPIMDQGSAGSCTGHAAVAAVGTSPLHEASGAAVLNHATAVAVYSEATRLDEFSGTYPPDDTGSSGLAVAKALAARGWISGYSHAFSMTDALGAVVEGPVITGVEWQDTMDTPDADGFIRVTASSEPRGGHEVCVAGVDTDRKAVLVVNSWGEGWGLKGCAWLTWDDWETLLAKDGDVTVLRPATGSEPPTRDAALREAFEAGNWVNKVHLGQTGRVARAARAWLANG
jgi:uncharacterized protein